MASDSPTHFEENSPGVQEKLDKYLSLATENMPGGLMFLDPDGTVDFCSTWMLRRLNLPDGGQVLGRHFTELLRRFANEARVEEARRGFEALRRDGSNYETQLRVKFPLQERSVCSMQILPLIAEGRFAGARLLIAERKILCASDVRSYYPLLETLPVACAIRSSRQRLLACNQMMLKLFEVDSEETLSTNFHLYSEEIQPGGEPSVIKAERLFSEAMETGHLVAEWMYLTARGKPFPARLEIRRVHWYDEPLLVTYITDQRPLMKKDARVQEAREWASTMLNSMPVCCLLFSRSYALLDCNAPTLKFYGVTNKRDLRRRFFSFNPPHQPDGAPSEQKARAMIRQAFATSHTAFYWEHRVNGESRPVRITMRRVYSRYGLCVASYMDDLRVAAKQAQEYGIPVGWPANGAAALR